MYHNTGAVQQVLHHCLLHAIMQLWNSMVKIKKEMYLLTGEDGDSKSRSIPPDTDLIYCTAQAFQLTAATKLLILSSWRNLTDCGEEVACLSKLNDEKRHSSCWSCFYTIRHLVYREHSVAVVSFLMYVAV